MVRSEKGARLSMPTPNPPTVPLYESQPMPKQVLIAWLEALPLTVRKYLY